MGAIAKYITICFFVAASLLHAQNDNFKYVKNSKTLAKWFGSLPSKEKNIIKKLNRLDGKYFARKDSVILPSTYNLTDSLYHHFPTSLGFIAKYKKFIFLSLEKQQFAAYENGKIVKVGPVNSGKNSTPTPSGLFFTTWKKKLKVSSVDSTWLLPFNVNFDNVNGIGFHQYELPGFPASHSCVRLLMDDAKWLYGWADQWRVKLPFNILYRGTPVIIFGEGRNFSRSKIAQMYINNERISQSAIYDIFLKYREKIEENESKKAN